MRCGCIAAACVQRASWWAACVCVCVCVTVLQVHAHPMYVCVQVGCLWLCVCVCVTVLHILLHQDTLDLILQEPLTENATLVLPG